jgi:PAS domain S-box-containing protein
MTKLYIINGPMEGQSFDLNGEITSVGRAPENDIQINDHSVSRKHLKIFRKGDQLYIEDLNSQNGTWIFGKQIKPGEDLQVAEGMPIALGKVFLSLGDGNTEEDMVIEYSIDLLKPMGKRWRNLPQNNRRIADRKHLELIHEVSTILMQSFDINEIGEKIMDALFSCLKSIDNGAILLIDDKIGELREIAVRARDTRQKGIFNYSRTIVNRVTREGKAVVMSDTSKEDKEDLSESIEMMRVKSIMCVPLIIKSEIRGAIYVHSVNVPYGFRKDDLLLLTGLSTPAAVAIENVLLYSKSKQTEEALRRSEEKYRALAEKVEDMVFTMSTDGRLIFGNPKAETLTGQPLDQLVQMTYRDFVAPESIPLVETQIASVSAGDVIDPFEIAILHADGRKVQIELTLSPLRDEEDELVEIQGVAKEIAEPKEDQQLTLYEGIRATP